MDEFSLWDLTHRKPQLHRLPDRTTLAANHGCTDDSGQQDETEGCCKADPILDGRQEVELEERQPDKQGEPDHGYHDTG